MKTILVVDDEPAARYGLRRALESRYRVVEAESAEEARAAIPTEKPDLMLLDVVMPGQDGISFLKLLREEGNELPVLIVSALDTAKTAVEALRVGAADYLVKGFELDELRQRVVNLLKLTGLEKENSALKSQLAVEGQFGGMIGRSPGMRRAFEMADRVAATDSTILILGESGTGKDLMAQEIHARSPRAGKPFVAVNCAALPENLIESELFGYERGAFTGAAQQKKGKFELATGGTLFLDEIGDMNPVTQAKVLRALENRTIERLGGSQSIPVDVRVISATHRDLPGEIAAGKFREDLFYRLRVITIELPSLREHREDIPVLADEFLRLHGKRLNRNMQLSRDAYAALERYDWPGNVRELKNAIERSMVLGPGNEIGMKDLPEEVATGKAITQKENGHDADSGMSEHDFREAKRKFEVAWITKQLASHRWNVSRTAATIGLHRQSLQEKLRELGIRRPGREPMEEEA
ncbi:MAG: sigma-54-dependent Fis family transcriptional regulator [Acidobacteria bacterium]|nr:sigma-54-dependent Fis family transcriptional regulator [Acidobacteriota bacterium]MBS1866994.1 sigma-54-dependent Fis family transcriptional regulator [Acidobacteriota bacterium]